MHGPTCIFWANLTPFSLCQRGGPTPPPTPPEGPPGRPSSRGSDGFGRAGGGSWRSSRGSDPGALADAHPEHGNGQPQNGRPVLQYAGAPTAGGSFLAPLPTFTGSVGPAASSNAPPPQFGKTPSPLGGVEEWQFAPPSGGRRPSALGSPMRGPVRLG